MLIMIFIYINFLPCGLHFTPFPSLHEGGKKDSGGKDFFTPILDVGGAGARSSLLAVLIIIVILSLSHFTNQ